MIDSAIVGTLALVLALPGFGFPYLFDDFDFLERVLRFTPTVLLPEPREIFYRPLSREAFFGVLRAFGAHGPLVGHILNALALIAATILLYSVSTRLLGRRSGLITGITFAGFGGSPLLVAWVSGSQDALAIAFLIGALSLELEGRHAVAIIIACLALLAKETVAVMIPAVALSNRLLGGTDRRDNRRILNYALLLIAWAAIHPGIHILARTGFADPALTYIGIDNPSRGVSTFRSLVTLANLPLDPLTTKWYPPLAWISIPALALAWFGGLRAASSPALTASTRAVTSKRVLLLGLALALPPLVLTAVIVKHWAPYYVCLPAVGTCIAFGALASKLRGRILAPILTLYVVAGLWVRCSTVDPGLPTERALSPASEALGRIESQVRALVPSVRPNTQFLVFILAQGNASVHLHFYNFQVLRSWFQDPTVAATRPEMREGARPEVLLWISPQNNVFRVDLGTLMPYSVTTRASYFEYQKVMRAYARGLARSGNVAPALRILLGMPEPNDAYRSLDYRIAAALLLQSDRRDESAQLLRALPPMGREQARDVVAGFLTAPGGSPQDDAAWFEAFGLSTHEAGDVRFVMERLNDQLQPAAERMAARLLTLCPGGDTRASEILAKAKSYPDLFAITPRGL